MKLVAIKFLLMCYSGLRFADAMKFNPDTHVIGEGRISMKTQKANVVLNLKSYDRLARVIALLRANPVLKITNRDFNRYLKVIAGACGIKLNLTCHVGRHTFGGILASMEVPEEQAQKLMAHKDINSTRIYYHVSDKMLDSQVDKLNNMK
jgi:integrase